MTRILLVEDDERIATDIATTLAAQGYMADHETNGEEAWFRGDTEDYAAIILDLGLPGMDGLSILKRWRGNNRNMPVIILTARGAWSERVEGIDAGADDYLPKPFQMEELIARLRSVLRRHAGKGTSLMTIGDLTLDERKMRVTVHGVPLSLSSLEYRLVAYMVRNHDRVVPQQELVEQVYASDAEPDSNALEVLMGRVRRKIGRDLIETRRGFGYAMQEPKQ
ncbi:MAG: response regulator transcription factor [Beijerinckiaceae bacterium]|jgi:two-component system, OmpR family, response regulator|nr:response regulator transcription factor [Beijerinckiaceae bacterium]